MKNTYKIQLLAAIFALLFSASAKSQCAANFSYTLNASGNVSFFNLSTPTNSNTLYYWNFGDSQTAMGTNQNHTYAGNGTYVVTLFANDSITPCSSTISQTITISNAVCVLNASYTKTVLTNGHVNFYNTTTGSISQTSYTLNFGDGNNAYYTNNNFNMASHTYTANGSYLAILHAKNSSGCVSTYSNVVNLTIQPCTLTANYTYTITNGTVNFSSTSTGTNSSTGYYWNFGNSNVSYSQNPPTQNYANGQYLVTLNLNDSLTTGCTSSHTQTITITNAPCVASSVFSVSKDSSFTSSIVWNAYPTYPSNVSNVVWNWGDNSSSTGLYPSHTYSAAGFYNICLTVSVSCGSSTTSCLNTNIFRGTNSMQMATINVQSNLPTGIVKNTASSIEILLFPNPVKDVLTIESAAAEFNVTISDLYGKIVYTGANTKNVNTQNLNAGIYFVKISGANFSKTSKIIKD